MRDVEGTMCAPAFGVFTSFILWSALTWCAVSANTTEDCSTLSAMAIDVSAGLTFFGLVAIAVGEWVISRSPDDREIGFVSAMTE